MFPDDIIFYPLLLRRPTELLVCDILQLQFSSLLWKCYFGFKVLWHITHALFWFLTIYSFMLLVLQSYMWPCVTLSYYNIIQNNL